MPMPISTALFNKLRFRLFAAFGLLILLATAGGILSFQLLNAVRDYQQAALHTGSMVRWIAEARKQEKNFILTDRKLQAFYENGSIASLEKHRQAIDSFWLAVHALEQSDVIAERGLANTLQTAAVGLNLYEESFNKLVDAYKIRGFKDFGLEGEMRVLVHALQAGQTQEEQLYALTLRKHEKDFFLRADEKYIDKLNAVADAYIAFLDSAELTLTDEAYRVKNAQAVEAYRKHFNQIAGIERNIGLRPEEGLSGALAEHAAFLEPLIATIQNQLVEQAESVSQQARLAMLGSGLGMLGVGMLVAFLLANRISRPIILLTEVISQVRQGNYGATEKLQNIKRKDEVGSLVSSFRELVATLQQQMQQVSAQKEQLEQAAAKEAGRNRLNEAQARFERMIAARSEGLAVMADQLLAELIKFLNLQQGAIYILQGEEGKERYLEMISCYAYKRKKYQGAKISKGEGLIGASWQEQDCIYITDLPESYGKIASGLGHSKPKSLFICPIATDQGIEGILELAGLDTLSEELRLFIQQVAKSLATTVAAYRMQEQTEQLLEQAKQLTLTLQENEEELRQNVEEMQASQEELQAQRHSLQKELTQASALLQLHKKAIRKLYSMGVFVKDGQPYEFVNEESRRLLALPQAQQEIDSLLESGKESSCFTLGSVSYACTMGTIDPETKFFAFKKVEAQPEVS